MSSIESPGPSSKHLLEIEARCDAFEEAWKQCLAEAAAPPNPADFICDLPDPLVIPTLLELVILDSAYRASAGRRSGSSSRHDAAHYEPLSWQDYVARLPQLEDLPAPAELAVDDSPIRVVESRRFEIGRHHASGGLGRVSLAHDAQLGRDVAIKEMSERYSSDATFRERFLREARLTGRLEHPNIVPVYAMGSEESASPFYVMRFVNGKTLRESIKDIQPQPADARSLTYQQRQLVSRFLDVCHAVRYAHSMSVIHRDIKPDNIMLGEFGETFLVDWGLAKHLGEQDNPSDSTVPRSPTGTQAGHTMGTPGYSSPEQSSGQWQDVDIRSDIYSLGATLFHIITGHPPRIPSGQGSPTTNHPRSAWLAICQHAMEPDPNDRYQQVSELITDVELALADQPVSVFRDRWSTRARRWVRRHQTATVASVVALLLVALGLAAIAAISSQHASATRQHAQILRQRNAALDRALAREATLRHRAEQSERHAMGAMTSVFSAIRTFDPIANGRDVPLIDALDDFRAQIQSNSSIAPGIRGRILRSLANTYYNLSRYSEAAELADGALALLQEEFEEDHPQVLMALATQAQVRHKLNDPDAWRLMQHTKQAAATKLDLLSPQRLQIERDAAVLAEELGEVRRARDELVALVPKFRTVYGEDSGEVLSLLNDVAKAEAACGNLAEAVRIAGQVYQEHTVRNGQSSLHTIISGANYAAHLLKASQRDEAVAVLERLIDDAQTALGDEHYMTLVIMNRLGVAYLDTDRQDKGIALIETALNRSRQAYGPAHPRTLVSANSLAGIFYRKGDYSRAIEHYSFVYEQSIRVRGATHPETLTVANNLASAYGLDRQFDKAIDIYRQTVAAQSQTLGRANFKTIRTMVNMAAIMQKANRHSEAIDVCRDVARLAQEHLGPDHPFRQTALSVMGKAYLALGDLDQAESPLTECLASRSRTMPDHWLRFHTMSLLGELRLRQGRLKEAEKLLTTAHDELAGRKEQLPSQALPYLREAEQRVKLLREAQAQSP